MLEKSDNELLAEFVRAESETAFAEIVARRINLVYSAALRFTGNSHHAEEITQAVFIILARKASSLGRNVVLSGWLYQTARLTSANFVKGEIRRQRREQEAYMQSTLNETDSESWEQIAPWLDEAMGKLGETDRNAIVLRFFENKSGSEVATAMKMNEAAAHKRVSRALEKLRKIFTRRGVISTSAIIAGVLSANSVQAAPVALATSISGVAITKGAVASGSTLLLVKGALKIMAWTKAKIVLAMSAGVLLAAGTTTVAVKEFRPDSDTDKYFLEMDWDTFQKTPPYFIVRPTHFDKPASNGTSAMGSAHRAVGRNMDLENMICYAYQFHNRTRVVFPTQKFPAGGYDFLVTVPDGVKKLQKEIKNQFGYQARKETRNVDALLIKVSNPNAPGLKASNKNDQPWQGNQFAINWSGYQIPELVGQIETWLSIPIVDQTGLMGNYSVQLDWERGSSDDAKEKLRKAVLDQLGLELISTNMPIEMLVVEKVK